MSRQIVQSAATALVLAMCAAPSLTQPAYAAADRTAATRGWAPPKTPWGDPDLRGTWPLDSVGQTPFQRSLQYGDQAYLTDAQFAAAQKAAAKAAQGYANEEKAGKLGMAHWSERGEPSRQTSLIIEPANGRLPPMTEQGKTLAKGMKSSWSQKVFDDLSDFNSLDLCITRGMPASMVPFPYNNGVRIFQGPGYVAIQLEIVHETRIIPLDGRAPLPGAMTTWLGSSRGHFEGDTLVVESGNFNGLAPMVIVGPTNQPVPTSRQLHITERLTPIGPNTLQYEARVEDPDVLTAPWKMSFPLTRNDGYRIYEYGCHEGNEQVGNYIRATSPRFAALRQKAADLRNEQAKAVPARPPG